MQPHTFLFTHWEGGGNTPPMIAIVRRLLRRGHSVRVLSDPCNREEVEQTGAAFSPWTRAPHRLDKSAESERVRDWEVSWPLALLARIRDRMIVGPSREYAEDVLEQLRRGPADVVVTSDTVFGAMVGAEAAAVPCAALSPNVYLFPRDGVPPFGPGLLPATSAAGRLRDWVVRTIALREFGKGTAAFNETRRQFGLPPLKHLFDQLERLAAHLVLTSAAFDFPSTSPPPRLIYCGPELGDPDGIGGWRSPWSPSDGRPLALVAFSTTYQNQAAVLARVIEGLRQLDVRAVVTTGPAIDPATLPAGPDIHVCATAPHSAILREASVVVTHAGHGTVMRALAAGVPLVCLPMGRDQNDTAARVVFRGVGVRLSADAQPRRIRDAVQDVLRHGAYRERALDLGVRIRADARESKAVPVLESIAERSTGAHRAEPNQAPTAAFPASIER